MHKIIKFDIYPKQNKFTRIKNLTLIIIGLVQGKRDKPKPGSLIRIPESSGHLFHYILIKFIYKNEVHILLLFSAYIS